MASESLRLSSRSPTYASEGQDRRGWRTRSAGSAPVEVAPVRPPERGPQLLQQPAPEGHREGPPMLGALPSLRRKKESSFASLFPGRSRLGCRTSEPGDFTLPSTGYTAQTRMLHYHPSAPKPPTPTST
ncbi:hypothetical protein HJG60_008244 [Phyllostomus discolor]|uniref:Uncharacterized protein n=1 Tax=Phyllostomus discolor TaxID=89673 RepID=A0A833Z6R8_9CHIR|nr:hypothetical protein HJG60_008244 [Phyllostomus discolor]